MQVKQSNNKNDGKTLLRNTFALSTLVIFTFLFGAHSYAQYQTSDQSKLVVIERLSFEYESSLVEAVGTAQAKRSTTLFASVTDEVMAVNFVPGQAVKKGDILVRLDSRLQDVALERTEIQLDDAIRNLNRIKQTVKRGAITERELDDADTIVKLAKVAHKEAEENKEDRLVRAPFDGIVGLTSVEVGDRINPQTEITSLDDRSDLFINFVAPELAVNFLMSKPDVSLQPWTNREVSLQAKIAELDSRVNIIDRTIAARALLINKDDQYRPGMSFRVSLAVRGERFIAIPEAALSWGANGAFVWLADNNKAKRVSVQVRQRLRGRILVSGELIDGEFLIIEGIQSLRDGQALQIQNPDEINSQIGKKDSVHEVAG